MPPSPRFALFSFLSLSTYSSVISSSIPLLFISLSPKKKVRATTMWKNNAEQLIRPSILSTPPFHPTCPSLSAPVPRRAMPHSYFVIKWMEWSALLTSYCILPLYFSPASFSYVHCPCLHLPKIKKIKKMPQPCHQSTHENTSRCEGSDWVDIDNHHHSSAER